MKSFLNSCRMMKRMTTTWGHFHHQNSSKTQVQMANMQKPVYNTTTAKKGRPEMFRMGKRDFLLCYFEIDKIKIKKRSLMLNNLADSEVRKWGVQGLERKQASKEMPLLQCLCSVFSGNCTDLNISFLLFLLPVGLERNSRSKWECVSLQREYRLGLAEPAALATGPWKGSCSSSVERRLLRANWQMERGC